MGAEPKREAARVVRLLGGLRALDACEAEVTVGVFDRHVYARFKRPEYAKLGAPLNRMGLRQVGVQFYEWESDVSGETPPRWAVLTARGKFAAMYERPEWSFIRSQAARSGQLRLASLAKRVQANIDLLGYRLLQLSDAYEATLNGALLQEGGLRAHQFSNKWTVQIDAALHGFLSDAGTFRDVLCEACWHLVLKEESRAVRKISSFLKAAPTQNHPLCQTIVDAARGGWIDDLSKLRDHVIHDAPVSEMHEFDLCDLRIKQAGSDASVPMLHFALTEADWKPRPTTAEYVDFSCEEKIRSALAEYSTCARRRLSKTARRTRAQVPMRRASTQAQALGKRRPQRLALAVR